MSLFLSEASAASGTSWTDPTNALTRDGSNARYTSSSAQDWLYLSSWSNIGTYVDGTAAKYVRKLKIVVVGKSSAASAADRVIDVALTTNGTTVLSGTDYDSNTVLNPGLAGWAVEPVNGTWGLTAANLTTALINASFGVLIRKNTLSAGNLDIDYVYMIVEFKDSNRYLDFGSGRLFVAQYQDIGFFTDGSGPLMMDKAAEDEPFWEVGLTAPSTVPSVDNSASIVNDGELIGNKRAYVTFKRTSDRARSNPSGASVDISMDHQKLTVFNIPTGTNFLEADSEDYRREVWVNLTGSGEAFLAAEITNNTDTSVVIDLSDEDGANRELLDFVGNDKPPVHRYIVGFKERLVGFGETVLQATVNGITGASNLVNLTWASTDPLRTRLNSTHEGKFCEFDGDPRRYVITSVVSPESFVISPQKTTGSPTTCRIFSQLGAAVSWSKAGYPQQWDQTESIVFAVQDADQGTGMLVHQGRVLCFMKRHIGVFDFQEDPAIDGSVATLVSGRGALESCAVSIRGMVYAMDTVGIYRYSGGPEVEDIDDPVRPIIEGRAGETIYIDWSQADRFWAQADERHGLVHFFVVTNTSSSGYPEHSLTYDYVANVWMICQWEQPLTCGGQVVYSDGRIAPIVAMGDATNGGYWWELWGGAADGVVEANQVHRGTATSATSTTLTDSGATFPTADNGLDGVTVHIESGTGAGQTRVISSNTATVLTVSSAWSVTPDSTSVYIIGRINVDWRSGWFAFDLPGLRKRLHEIRVYAKPDTGTDIINMELFRDFETTALNAKVERNSEGVSSTVDSGTYVIKPTQREGLCRLRIDGVWGIVWQIRLYWNQAGERPKIDNATLFAQLDPEFDPASRE